MARVPRCHACLALVAALLLMLLVAVAPGAARADVVAATVGPTPTGQAMPAGFVGVSFEYKALHQYTGRDPRAIDPALLGLLAGLAPGQSPVIRVGGNSTDDSWWPIRGMIAPGGVSYPITAGWLRTARALASDLNARMILGINLAAGRPAIAGAEARALVSGIGRQYIAALEIGNEPDLYGLNPWYRDRRGHTYAARSHSYSLGAYTRQFNQWGHALPSLPLAGPATASPLWMGVLGGFVSGARRLGIVTYHRYPLRACSSDPTDPLFPSIANLLADSSSAGLAAAIAPYAQQAHQAGLPFRLDELNTASCQGSLGTSDTFASALWALNTLFNLAAVGVDGVNVHMLPGSAYELFTVSHSASGAWQAFVHPEYYGLLLFAQAFPVGARLLPVTIPAGQVKAWATQAADGTIRVTMINQDTVSEHDVSLQVPGAGGTGAVQTLRAGALNATSGVTLGGQTFGAETTTGTLPGPPAATPVIPSGGSYTVSLAPGTAALLTIPPGP